MQQDASNRFPFISLRIISHGLELSPQSLYFVRSRVYELDDGLDWPKSYQTSVDGFLDRYFVVSFRLAAFSPMAKSFMSS